MFYSWTYSKYNHNSRHASGVAAVSLALLEVR